MRNFFTIIYEALNLSKNLKDFGTASVGVELAVGEYINVGYEKFFNQFFIELDVKNTNPNTISAEYYDGTNWVDLASLLEESEGFTKSGFFFFDKPNDWKKTTIAGETKYFIRLLTDANHSAGTKIAGIAILLSNDLDLQGVRSNIVSKFNNGNSWILKHEQVRKDIIQALRNKGNRIVSNADKNNSLVSEGVRFADLSEFDLLVPEQLRQASLYKVLSSIYLDELSDEIDDKWHRQGIRYEEIYFNMFNLFYLQIDFNDDGISNAGETVVSTNTALVWN